jgi:hypothetical protein
VTQRDEDVDFEEGCEDDLSGMGKKCFNMVRVYHQLVHRHFDFTYNSSIHIVIRECIYLQLFDNNFVKMCVHVDFSRSLDYAMFLKMRVI